MLEFPCEGSQRVHETGSFMTCTPGPQFAYPAGGRYSGLTTFCDAAPGLSGRHGIEVTPDGRQKMQHYDIVIIGSGPSGRRAAIQSAKLGKAVLVVDKGQQHGSVGS
jgi:NADPH-dependent 2,4-dienoyl-CoA reductase/sulfur reductase-like enzyme